MNEQWNAQADARVMAKIEGDKHFGRTSPDGSPQDDTDQTGQTPPIGPSRAASRRPGPEPIPSGPQEPEASHRISGAVDDR